MKIWQKLDFLLYCVLQVVLHLPLLYVIQYYAKCFYVYSDGRIIELIAKSLPCAQAYYF